jgi:hypothetical protein
MYVYVTPECRKRLAEYGHADAPERIAERVRGLRARHHLQGIFQAAGDYVRKRLGKCRLYGKYMHLADLDAHVVCLLDVYMKKDAKEDELLDQIRVLGPKRLDPLLPADEPRRTVQRLVAEDRTTPEPASLPLLPDEMKQWLAPLLWQTEKEVIYESTEWVRNFRSRKVRDFWQSYYSLILDVVDAPAREAPTSSGLCVKSSGGRSIIYTRLHVTGAARDVLFLVAALPSVPSEDDLRRAAAHVPPAALRGRSGSDDALPRLALDEVAPYADRSYPAWILGREELWHAIQDEEEANLALSAEEEQVLEAVCAPGGLPTFINGRAGTGKSTMLLHLFAEFCERKLSGRLPFDPLYLTYNDRLVAEARRNVSDLLRAHSRYLDKSTQWAAKDVERFFQPFRAFLLGMLPVETQEWFAPGRHINFNLFRQLYTGNELPADHRGSNFQSPIRRRHSPELVWHVIRTFIKGRGLEHTDPDDYVQIPRRDRTVTPNVYREIFEHVFEGWYGPLTEDRGYWDDQDLVHCLLTSDVELARHAAIFIDEAQDLTRVELQLVMKLSAFGNYDLRGELLGNIPFAFAGDPLQTLNPTGFRWAALKTDFHEEVLGWLSESDRQRELSFHELRYNYRSSAGVVKLTNVVQLWRHVLLANREIAAQKPWRLEEAPEPRVFVLGDNISKADLEQKTENTIIIVPCEEGQEKEFVQADPELSSIIPLPPAGEPIKNVLSAVAAKGLQFNRVVLYKFGERADPAWWRQDENDDGVPVEEEYFFNKLYVAATRAERLLFIIDSQDGYDRLWQLAASEEALERLVAKAKNAAEWSEWTTVLEKGTRESANELTETDPLTNAERLRESGHSQGRADDLRRAAQFYDAVGRTEDAQGCRADALRLTGEFASAGALYEQLGKQEAARWSYWEGECWQELLAWYRKHDPAQADKAFEFRLASFMFSGGSPVESIAGMTELVTDEAAQNFAQFKKFRKQSVSAVNALLERCRSLAPEHRTTERLHAIAMSLEQLANSFMPSLRKDAGAFFKESDDLNSAVRCWERAGQSDTTEYYLAKAELTSYPNNLEWLQKAKATDRIVKAWDDAGGLSGPALPVPLMETVISALEARKRFLDAFRAWQKLDDCARVEKAYEPAMRDAPADTDRWQIHVDLINYLTRKRQWESVLRHLDIPGKYKTIASNRDRFLLRCEVARELVASEPGLHDLSQIGSQVKAFADGITGTKNWQSELSLAEVGTLYELCGEFVPALGFYEQTAFGPAAASTFSRDDVVLARQRWIVIKRRQVDDLARRGKRLEAQTREDELKTQCQEWGLTETPDAPLLPLIPTAQRRGARVTGLPPGARVTEDGDGNFTFALGRIHVTGRLDPPVVSVQDTRTLESLRIDLRGRTLVGHSEIQQRHEEDGRISFENPAAEYGGTVVFGPDSRVELRSAGQNICINLSK